MRLKSAGFAIVALSGLAACAPAAPPPPAAPQASLASAPTTVSEVDQEVVGTVQDVDMESRLLTVRHADGSIEHVYAPAEVTNLPQVKVGDQVVVTYVAAITAAKTTDPGTPTAVVDRSVVSAPKGSTPGAASGQTVTTVVTVDAYDPATHVVTFTGPKGVQRTAQIMDPKMQVMAGTLKTGDMVEVTLSEAAAVTIERPRS